jgi:hypothetical protein
MIDNFFQWFQEYGKTDAFAVTGLAIGIIAYIPYLISVITDPRSRPAISTWSVWSMLSLVTFLGQMNSGKVYPQTAMYLILDPVVLICAILKRNWSPFETEDLVAVGLGALGGVIIFLSPQESRIALAASLFGIVIAGIPTIKNLVKDPFCENKASWIIFTSAGFFSMVSSLYYFTSWIDVVTPMTYFLTCLVALAIMIRLRKKVQKKDGLV